MVGSESVEMDGYSSRTSERARTESLGRQHNGGAHAAASRADTVSQRTFHSPESSTPLLDIRTLSPSSSHGSALADFALTNGSHGINHDRKRNIQKEKQIDGVRADDVYGTVVDISDLFKRDGNSPKSSGAKANEDSQAVNTWFHSQPDILEHANSEQVDVSRSPLYDAKTRIESEGNTVAYYSPQSTREEEFTFQGWRSDPQIERRKRKSDTRLGPFVSSFENEEDNLTWPSRDSVPIRSTNYTRRRWYSQPSYFYGNRRKNLRTLISRSLEFEKFLNKYINELSYDQTGLEKRFTTGAGCGMYSRRRHLERYIRRAASAMRDANRLQEMLQPERPHTGKQAQRIPATASGPQRVVNKATVVRASRGTSLPRNAGSSLPKKYAGSYRNNHLQHKSRPGNRTNREEPAAYLPFGKLPIELSVEEYLQWQAQNDGNRSTSDSWSHEEERDQESVMNGRTDAVRALEDPFPDIFRSRGGDSQQESSDTAGCTDQCVPSTSVSMLNAVSAVSTLMTDINTSTNSDTGCQLDVDTNHVYSEMPVALPSAEIESTERGGRDEDENPSKEQPSNPSPRGCLWCIRRRVKRN